MYPRIRGAIRSNLSIHKGPSSASAVAVRWLTLCFLFSLTVPAFSTGNDFQITDNEPFWFVYHRFEGYHACFDELEPVFRQEISTQGLSGQLVGRPFNVYFSETDWAIGCRLEKKCDLTPPLEIQNYGSKKVIRAVYRGEDRNIPLFLEVANSWITGKNYYWDGCLILNRLADNPADPAVDLMIPVTRDYYKLFIRPYGIVRIVIAFLCLLLAVFLLSYKKGSILSNRLLGIFLLTYILLNCNTFIWIYNIYNEWPHLYNFAISFQFLLGPLLLLYSLSVVDEKFRLRKWHLLHFLPFVVVAVMYFFLFQIHDTESKRMLLSNGFHESPFFEWEDKAEMLQKISYILGSVFVVFKVPWKKSQVAFHPEKHLLDTLKFLLISLLALLVTEWIRNEIPVQAGIHYIIKAAAMLVYLVMVSVLMVRGLLYPEMFSGNSRNGNGRKYHKSPLTREHKTFYLQRILSYMDRTEPYLSSSVNLTDFAKEISIPSRYLSQVLNEELGMSFYDFMNKYRIDKAGKLLADPGNTNHSIIDVAWECGFNSKSVFNAAFKKFKGMTPSEFRMDKLQAIFQDP